MASQEIRAAVKDYIMEEFLPGEDPATVSDSTALLSEGILDSIATIKLAAWLEDHYGIELEAHEMSVDNLDSIAAIAAIVTSKLEARG
ncbi:MAG: acyl carrier protein [Planctomycetes bacterium]|nr:acyl carrier protein [Planctomycetota bacterium]